MVEAGHLHQLRAAGTCMLVPNRGTKRPNTLQRCAGGGCQLQLPGNTGRPEHSTCGVRRPPSLSSAHKVELWPIP